jgi:polyribonucleotide nucleotidyltransferase
MKRKLKKIQIGEDQELIFETGKIAKQANGSVLLRQGETVVFSTACAAAAADANIDFFPLRVDYQEKFSSAGKTLGGFIKREGRPTEREVLVSRLIDRPLRPMFEDGFYNETQVLSYVWSYDGVHQPDPLAICAASAALVISDIPLIKPVAAVRVGIVNDQYIVNPTTKQMAESKLDLMLAGTHEAILMIEGYCDFLTRAEVLAGIEFGHKAIIKICEGLSEWQAEVGKEKFRGSLRQLPQELCKEMEEKFAASLTPIFKISDKKEREVSQSEKYGEIATYFAGQVNGEGAPLFSDVDVKMAIKKLSSKIMREQILSEGVRSDGRGTKDIRPIDVEINLLPRTHGSCLFTRGETQTMATCTLGGESMGQRFEDLDGEGLRRFYLQYSFPPFSVGEVGRMGSPGRREIGHGKLAERALQAVVPDLSHFPYTIRLESNITESNGSSSMASVCGCCVSMMAAGVPIKRPVAGIAMGLILEDKRVKILSDILGIEDALGDMDFKITGDGKGITAFQMDIKVEGITLEIMKEALAQAEEGISHILGKMTNVIAEPISEMSQHAPRIETMQVKQNKIATIIGPGGKQIRAIIEETGVQIDINDSGLVSIASNDQESMARAKEIIEGLVGDVEVGKVYKGPIKSVVPFGIFVEILPGKEGLCHISELSHQRVNNIFDYIKEGEIVEVKVIDITERGQLKLSRKALQEKESEAEPAAKES